MQIQIPILSTILILSAAFASAQPPDIFTTDLEGWVAAKKLFGGHSSTGSKALSVGDITEALKKGEIEATIHAAAPTQGLVVLTVRNPDDFFDAIELSLVPGNEAVKKVLPTLNRHDEVVVQGTVHTTPQPHLKATSLKVTQAYADPYRSAKAFERDEELRKHLNAQSETTFLVHAVPQGSILVVEYQNAIVPVYTIDDTWTRDLYRGDRVRMHYRILKSPRSPVHLQLDESQTTPLKVTQEIRKDHGNIVEIEGDLAYFPKSPQLKFGVFALRKVDADGLVQTTTLVNFSDFAIFQAILDKAGKAWKDSEKTLVRARNYFYNPKLHLKAKGTWNVVSKSQANPQILLDKSEDLEITVMQ